MRGHVLDRSRSRWSFSPALMASAIGHIRACPVLVRVRASARAALRDWCRASVHAGLWPEGRADGFGLLIGKARVGGAELDVGHDAVILPVAAADDGKGALLHVLWGTVSRTRKFSFSPPPTI